MAWLDLSIIPHQEISQEEANMLNPIQIKFNHGYVKKTKKNTNQIEIKIEDVDTTSLTISGQNLHSIREWYSFIKNSCNLDKQYLLFGRSSIHNIGSGFVSDHLHFASFLVMGIYEFLLISVNEYQLNRMLTGKAMLPADLATIMKTTNGNVTSVDEILTQHQSQRENNFVQMVARANELPARTVNQVQVQENIDPLTNITVWRRYSTLLYSVNNICFSIDEHFNNLGRTVPLNEDIVREVCTEILTKHKEDDQT